jgi:hypothetical protein
VACPYSYCLLVVLLRSIGLLPIGWVTGWWHPPIDAMVVAGRKVEDGWQLMEVYPPALSLQFGGNRMVAMLAVMICRRSGGPSRRQSGVSSTSMVDAPLKASRQSPAYSRRQVVLTRRCQGDLR